MYEQRLDEIAAKFARRGRAMQPAATDAEVADLRKRARQRLRYDVPDAYLAFLRRTNGLDYNGLSIYSSARSLIAGTSDRTIPGLVEANEEWRAGGEYRDQVVFAHSSTSNFVFHLTDKAWQIRMQPTDTLIETAESFEDLIFRALGRHLPQPE